MGLRKRVGGAESRQNEPESSEVGAADAIAREKKEQRRRDEDDDEDSDSEMQEVYVQAYACQIFRDDAAAQAVEDGDHLRALTAPQDPEGEPLMLDRFDARWMLDLTDFNKGSGTSIPASFSEDERRADSLRYAGLPKGDHSILVEGVGTFAPTGSYAHDRPGGLGGDEEEEPEVYGYYGRTASPPPPPQSTLPAARGAWSATPAPTVTRQPVDGGEVFSGVRVIDTQQEEKMSKGTGDEDFVPDFPVPAGIMGPSNVRQHVMIVSTARNAVRSPQLEVLLRLKQASNAAFSFLSQEDPIYPYYVFLKSWGEAALAGEYERQQRLQAQRAEQRRKKEEDRRKEEERHEAEAAAAVADSAAKAEPSVSLLPRSVAAEDSDDAGAPNLLGGAYDSSGDEEDTEARDTGAEDGYGVTVSSPFARVERGDDVAGNKVAGSMPPPPTGLRGDGPATEKASDLDEAKRAVVEKMVNFVSRNGQAFEDRVREREKSNPAFDFLSPTSKHHAFYKQRLAMARGEIPVPATLVSTLASNVTSGAASEHEVVANSAATPTPGKIPVARGSSDPTNQESVPSIKPASVSTRNGGISDVGGGRRVSGVVTATAAGSADNKLAANAAPNALVKTTHEEIELPGSGKNVEGLTTGDAPAAIGRSGRPAEICSARGASDSGDVKGNRKVALEALEHLGTWMNLGGAGKDDSDITAFAAGGEDPETRRANRLKRARLMKGHYKLAVLHDPSGRETGADVGQEQQQHQHQQEVASNDASLEIRTFPKKGKGEDADYLSADGISDLDDDDDDDDNDDADDVGDDGDNDDDSDEDDGKEREASPIEAPATGKISSAKKSKVRTTPRDIDSDMNKGVEDARSRRGRRESRDKRESRGGTGSRRCVERVNHGRRRSRSRSVSLDLAGGGRSSPRSRLKGDNNSKNGDMTGKGRSRERKRYEGEESRRRSSPGRRSSSPGRRSSSPYGRSSRKGAEENRGGGSGRNSGGRADRDEGDRKKRRASRSPERDRAVSSKNRANGREDRSKGRVSGVRRGESRERARERSRRGGRDDGDADIRRGAQRDNRGDRDRDSRERRANRRRSRSRESRERSRERRGGSSSKRLSSRRRL